MAGRRNANRPLASVRDRVMADVYDSSLVIRHLIYGWGGFAGILLEETKRGVEFCEEDVRRLEDARGIMDTVIRQQMELKGGAVE